MEQVDGATFANLLIFSVKIIYLANYLLKPARLENSPKFTSQGHDFEDRCYLDKIHGITSEVCRVHDLLNS
jgi:hypothetical protein